MKKGISVIGNNTEIICKNIKASGGFIINGVLVGKVDAEFLHIGKTGKIIGDIVCKSLSVDEGGKIEGEVKIKQEKQVNSLDK